MLSKPKLSICAALLVQLSSSPLHAACSTANLAGTWVAYIAGFRCEFAAGKKSIKPGAVCDNTANTYGYSNRVTEYMDAVVTELTISHDCSITGTIAFHSNNDDRDYSLKWFGQMAKSKAFITGWLIYGGGAVTIIKK